MKILITGAGSQLSHALQAALIRDDLITLPHQQLDITRLEAVHAAVRAHLPHLVLNTAAYNGVDAAEHDPDAAYSGNALGPRNLAIVTAAHHVPLLHISTDYVFDGAGTRPYHEFDVPRPRSVYGASKLAGEEAVRAFNPCHYIVRTAWLYHTSGRNFPKAMCVQAQEKSEVSVVSDQIGSPTYAPHLAAAIARLITTGAYGTYHFAGRGGTSWFELTRTLYRLLGLRTLVRAVTTAEFPRPAERPRYSVLTTLQDPQILLPPWEEGLAEFVRNMGGQGDTNS